MISLTLALLAIILAWPAPLLLGRATWPSKNPMLALVLWQGVAVVGGLAMLGALIAWGFHGAKTWNDVTNIVTNQAQSASFTQVLALCAAILVLMHLSLNVLVTLIGADRQRKRHAALVHLLSSRFNDEARVIEAPEPFAYCLPGPLRSLTVVSAGLIKLLNEEELQAVIEHERAHAAQRHDLLLVCFRAWHNSFPWFPMTERVQNEVRKLIEMMADDRARRFVSDNVLATALILVNGGHPENKNGNHLQQRLDRLTRVTQVQ